MTQFPNIPNLYTSVKWKSHTKDAYSAISPAMAEEFCNKNGIPRDDRMKILVLCSADSGGVGYYRAYQPCEYLNRYLGDKVIAISSCVAVPELIYEWADIVVFSRVNHPDHYIFATRTKAKTVYEIDDWLHGVDPVNPAYQVWNHENFRYWWSAAIMDVCSAIQVSTKQLLEHYPKEKSAVLENCIDPSLFPSSTEPKPKDEIRIGWAGSTTHIKDLLEVGPTLKRLHEEYGKKIKIVTLGFSGRYESMEDGLERDVLFGVPREEREGTPIAEGGYYQALANMNLDIVFCPIEDSEFNRCKSNLKTLEFGALGLPIVASRVEPYLWSKRLHGTSIMPLASNSEEWYELLRFLIDNFAWRRDYGTAIKHDVEQQYDIRKRVHEYYDFYKSLI